MTTLKETGFTPGPWKVGKLAECVFSLSGGSEDTCVSICDRPADMYVQLLDMYVACEDEEESDEPWNANARLIAAAPELLAALQRAVPWLGKMIADQAHLNSILPRDCEIALEQAEAAIAKAVRP